MGEIGGPTGAEETVGADLREPAREDVLEKAREERGHWEREMPRLVRARMRVAERRLAVRGGLQPLVGEGHAIDVAGEIARRVLPAPHLLDVHDPPLLPHPGIDRAREAGAGEGVSHLGAKDL